MFPAALIAFKKSQCVIQIKVAAEESGNSQVNATWARLNSARVQVQCERVNRMEIAKALALLSNLIPSRGSPAQLESFLY